MIKKTPNLQMLEKAENVINWYCNESFTKSHLAAMLDELEDEDLLTEKGRNFKWSVDYVIKSKK